jgi:hypothetical protein
MLRLLKRHLLDCFDIRRHEWPFALANGSSPPAEPAAASSSWRGTAASRPSMRPPASGRRMPTTMPSGRPARRLRQLPDGDAALRRDRLSRIVIFRTR